MSYLPDELQVNVHMNNDYLGLDMVAAGLRSLNIDKPSPEGFKNLRWMLPSHQHDIIIDAYAKAGNKNPLVHVDLWGLNFYIALN